MGTSLCLIAVPWPTRSDGSMMSPDDVAGNLYAQTVTLGLLAAEELCEDMGGAPEDVLDGEQLADLIGWVRGTVTEAIEYLFGKLDDEQRFLPRDAATLTLDGKVWLFGGGSDGGDGYDAVRALEAVGLL